MTLRTVRLELARTPDHPEGDARHGYELVAPLTDDGHLDAAEWRDVRGRCVVRHFVPGENDEAGHLVHTRNRNWVFSYAPGEDDDESIFKLDRHRFAPGEYVSITEHDGKTRPFKVAWVR